MNTPPRRMAPYRMLDAWRGVASLAVVFFHWSEIAVRRAPELKENLLYALSGYGNLGVQLFFVISGFCIANAAASNLQKGEGIGSYLIARARRIYPTYWAALLLTAGFVQISSLLAARGVIAANVFTQADLYHRSLLNHFANITLTMVPLHTFPLLVVAWTLCYEVAFYALVALAIGAASYLRRPAEMLTLLHGLTLTALVLLLVAPLRTPFPLDLWPHFGLGVLVYDILSRPERRATRGYLAAALLLFAAFIVTYDLPIGFLAQPSRLSFSVAAVFALLLLAAYPADSKMNRALPVRVLAFVGLFSYSLYLTHTIMIRIVNQGLLKLHLPVAYHYLYFVLGVGGAVIFAYGFYRIFERPVVEWGRQPKKRPAPTPETAPDLVPVREPTA